MHRLLPIVLLLVAACEAGGGAEPLPSNRARALFPAGGVADVIEIETLDRLPLRTAALIAPDGEATPAGPIDTEDTPGYAAGQFVATDPVHTDIFNATGPATLTPGDPLAGAGLRSQGRLLAIQSRASIALPDRVAYRREWQRYRIRLGFGAAAGAIETREIAAPQPPP